MPNYTLHAIDGTASNVLGSGFTWGHTGAFTYDEANTQIETLVFTDNDAVLTVTNTSLEQLHSLNGIIQNSNARVGGSWTVTGSDGSSFKVWRMLAPAQVEGYLLFTQDLTNGMTYTLSGFTTGDPMPYAQIAQQNTPCFTAGTLIDTPTGAKPVETLRTGDLVRTLHHGPQSIRWIGKSHKTFTQFSARQTQTYSNFHRCFGTGATAQALTPIPSTSSLGVIADKSAHVWHALQPHRGR